MFTRELSRHFREVAQNICNFKFERSPDGIFIPSMKAVARGVFTEWPGNPLSLSDRAAAGVWNNKVTLQGLNYLVSVGLLSGTQIPLASFYLAIGSGVGPVAANWTGANYTTNATEITAESPEGYDETVRQPWAGVADVIEAAADNTASPATVTIATAGSLNVNNAALIGSDNVKGGTTGTLIGCVIYGVTRTLSDNDVYNIQYEFDLNAT